MDYLMGIDLGSTSLKAIIYDLNGNTIASGSRPTERHHPNPEHPEWTVWLPEQIWADTAAAIKEAVSHLDDPRQIQALAVTGMGMDGVPIDEEGQWLYPFISWHDPRTAPQLQWWKEHIGAEKFLPTMRKLEMITRTGIVIGAPWGWAPHNIAYDNPHTEHRSHYYSVHFERLGYRVAAIGPKDRLGSHILAWKLAAWGRKREDG